MKEFSKKEIVEMFNEFGDRFPAITKTDFLKEKGLIQEQFKATDWVWLDKGDKYQRLGRINEIKKCEGFDLGIIDNIIVGKESGDGWCLLRATKATDLEVGQSLTRCAMVIFSEYAHYRFVNGLLQATDNELDKSSKVHWITLFNKKKWLDVLKEKKDEITPPIMQVVSTHNRALMDKLNEVIRRVNHTSND